MDKLEPPKPLSFDGNNHPADWKKWKKLFDYYITATEKNTKSCVKTSILLSCIGEKGREVYDSFDFPAKENEEDPDPSMVLDAVVKKFEEYCNPRKNTTILRHKFFSYKQIEGQSFSDYVTQLKLLSQDCEFLTLKDSLVVLMIICGVFDGKLKERMLRESDIDLDKAIKLGEAAEQTKKHVKQMKSEPEHEIHGVQKASISESSKNVIHNCKYCAGSHTRGQCEAFGKRCRNCNKMNHYAKSCLSRRNSDRHNNNQDDRQVNSIDMDNFL